MKWTREKPYYLMCKECKEKVQKPDNYCKRCGRKLNKIGVF